VCHDWDVSQVDIGAAMHDILDKMDAFLRGENETADPTDADPDFLKVQQGKDN
jgi:hypothetical protein